MKTRVISGVVAAVIGIAAMCFIFTPIFEIFIAFLSAVAAWEIMRVANVKSKLILCFAVAFSAAVPFYSVYIDKINPNFPTAAVLGLYVVLMMSLMLRVHKTVKFEQLAICLYASVFVPYAFSCALTLRDTYLSLNSFTKAESVYLVLFGVLISVFTDTFAYFVGVNFGKHKLCPNISPKKSIEGAVGGLVLAVALNTGIFALAKHFFFAETQITFTFIIITSFILSIISMFGDLSASVLKRNFGVKDFGKIIPGHGGIMDRFDSFIFVLPTLAACFKIMNM